MEAGLNQILHNLLGCGPGVESWSKINFGLGFGGFLCALFRGLGIISVFESSDDKYFVLRKGDPNRRHTLECLVNLHCLK